MPVLQTTEKFYDPTLASGAVAANDAANYLFSPAAQICLLSVNDITVHPLHIKVNSLAVPASPAAGEEATETDYDFIVSAVSELTMDLTLDGEILVKNVSIFAPTGTLGLPTKYHLRGISS